AVDFDLTDDQIDLRDGARTLLDALASPERVRAHTESGAPYDQALWDGMVEQGWLAMGVPEEHGGLGLGGGETAVVLEGIGRHGAPVPFLSSSVACGALGRAGHPSWEALAAGERLGCVAWSASGVCASSSGALTGRPDPVLGAPSASVAVVIAHDES